METFLALPEEKQTRIVEAGFHCFGKMGYKKASAQDIAQLAGISKGMIFHYFGSKKGMYLYLIKLSYDELTQAFQRGFDPAVTDFFDRFLLLTTCKINCLKKHPSLLSFLASLYAETAPEVAAETQELLAQGKQMRTESLLYRSDKTKFKDPTYADLTWSLLMGYGERYASAAITMDTSSLSALQANFEACISMLKQNLYKKEYL